jgi:hypothetical protein
MYRTKSLGQHSRPAQCAAPAAGRSANCKAVSHCYRRTCRVAPHVQLRPLSCMHMLIAPLSTLQVRSPAPSHRSHQSHTRVLVMCESMSGRGILRARGEATKANSGQGCVDPAEAGGTCMTERNARSAAPSITFSAAAAFSAIAAPQHPTVAIAHCCRLSVRRLWLCLVARNRTLLSVRWRNCHCQPKRELSKHALTPSLSGAPARGDDQQRKALLRCAATLCRQGWQRVATIGTIMPFKHVHKFTRYRRVSNTSRADRACRCSVGVRSCVREKADRAGCADSKH